MYLPQHFEMSRVDVMHALIRARPLAALVTLTANGLVADHIPLLFAPGPTPDGSLHGHVARANPLWREFDKDHEVLAIFQGPDSYVSPSWYATKKETGKVVPTWNYAVVHARGTLRVIDEAGWIRAQIEALTTQNEAALARPWSVADAPRDYTEKLIAAVVGIEIRITRLTGKWKVSQNQPLKNQASVIDALRCLGDDERLAMAELIEAHIQPSRHTD